MFRSMPVLQVRDVLKSEQFYREKLGFKTNGIWGDEPAFCILQRGDVTIALDRARSEETLPVNQMWAAYIYVEDADALCAEFQHQGVEIPRAPEDTFYNMRDFDVRDPDGHTLAFGHDLQSSQVSGTPDS